MEEDTKKYENKRKKRTENTETASFLEMKIFLVSMVNSFSTVLSATISKLKYFKIYFFLRLPSKDVEGKEKVLFN